VELGRHREARGPRIEAAHPGIKVEVVNAGSSSEEYKALDNAIQAGSGVPDLVMFEYFAIPYFAIPGKLADLAPLGASGFADDYVPSAWNNVRFGEHVYALPSDFGPAVMFWNSKTFAEAGITKAPATWEDYYQAAKKIRALGPDYYIAQTTVTCSSCSRSSGRPEGARSRSTAPGCTSTSRTRERSGLSPSGSGCSTRSCSTRRSIHGRTTGTGP
jgi:hypothetical protein